MSTAEALRELLRVVRQTEHPDQMQRPSEEEYQAAILVAKAALENEVKGYGRG